jgi:hypothetical protein
MMGNCHIHYDEIRIGVRCPDRTHALALSWMRDEKPPR